MKNNLINEKDISIVYCGDETDYRKKESGHTLMDQLFYSVESLRKNWSKNIEIYFIHTKKLKEESLNKLDFLNVKSKIFEKSIHPDFLMANKILACKADVKTKYTLFLDNDTFIHKPIELSMNNDLLVAFDVLESIEKKDVKKIFSKLNIEMPKKRFSKSPAYEYYYNDNIDIFPMINAGVYLIKTDLFNNFCHFWKRNFLELYSEFKNEKWSFYLEQMAFVSTIFDIKINYGYLPKGYNFICTPRADGLKNWPIDQIFIEHYAGDTSYPINKYV